MNAEPWPEVRYAKSGDVNIAYSVAGDAALDVILVPSWASNIELSWEDPRAARLYRRLASFSRLITFDKRGTGLSDRLGDWLTLEARMEDVRAVMDAVGSETAALVGFWEGGPMSALFAATYPERVRALVLYGTTAAYTSSPGYPWAPTREENEALSEEVEAGWGRGAVVDRLAPSRGADERFRRWWARLERNSLSPGDAAAMFRLNAGIDVRAILPAIRVPTLVLHRSQDAMVPVEAGRYVAEHVPGSRFVELPGVDHLIIDDVEAFASPVQEFLTGVRSTPEVDRVLTTVLFTDIVGSTERASALGDQAWQELLDAYRAVVRSELRRFRGREVDTAGDGFFATFDGPARAIRCALAARDAVRSVGLDIRAGVHTGEVILAGDKVAGIAVHIGARIMGLAGAGEVFVSSTVKDLVGGAGIQFDDRGIHLLKGIADPWRAFAASDPSA